jgi:hypothetical protein
MCYIQLPSRLTRFKSTSIKPYFRPKNTYDVKLDKLETTNRLDKPEVPAKLNNLKAPLPTLKTPKELTKPIKPTIKCG